MRDLTYFVAVTQDGFIAGPNGETDDFDASEPVLEFIIEHFPESLPAPARQHFGIDTANAAFDTVLMGRETYEVGLHQGLTSPYPHLRQVVFSTTFEGIDPSVSVVHDDALEAVRTMKQEPGRGIWLCGGGRLAGTLIDAIDVLIIKRQPLALGSGRPMFTAPFSPRRFHLLEQVSVGAITVETLRRSSS